LARDASGAPAADDRVKEILKHRANVRDLLAHANDAYARWYNKKKMPMAFAPGDWVWLSTKHLRQRRPSRKLADKYLGPFKILKEVGGRAMAYKLDLPQRYRIHHTFPISLLEPFNGTAERAAELRETVDLEPEAQEYEVEEILDHRGPAHNRHYLVKWVGYPPEDNTWEPAIHINDGPIFRAYEAQSARSHLRRSAQATGGRTKP
jgi:hypothetical protein